MGGEGSSYHIPKVLAAAGSLQQRAGGLGQTLTNLEEEVRKVQQLWDGEAQRAYGVAQQKWSQDILDMKQLLSKIATTTEDIANRVQQKDQANAATFSA